MLYFNAIIAFIFSFLMSFFVLGANTDLEKSQAVVVTDDKNAIWWGKYVNAQGEIIQVKLKPANKNISYRGSNSFLSKAPRERVIPCSAPINKMHICLSTRPYIYRAIRVHLACANGIMTDSSGNYYFPKQYSPEIESLGDIKKGAQIQVKYISGYRKGTVKHVFANNYVHYHVSNTFIDAFAHKQRIQIIYTRPAFNSISEFDSVEESSMVSLLESKSTNH